MIVSRREGRRRRISVGVAVALVLLVVVAGAANAHRKNVRAAAASPEARARLAQRVIVGDLDYLDAALDTLSQVLSQAPSRARVVDAPSNDRVMHAFRVARTRFKQIEGAVEFYAPAPAAALNSRRQEVDDEDAPPPSTLGARGFPALEDLLLVPHHTAHGDSLAAAGVAIVAQMRGTVHTLHNAATQLRITDAQLIEIARQELARVSTLGIAGFDAPRTGRAMLESADALDGVRFLYSEVGAEQWPALARERWAVDSTLRAASVALRAHPDFLTFDRLGFLVGYAEPAAQAVEALRRAIGTEPVLMRRPWRVNVASVYDVGAFDARVYAPAAAPLPTAELIALGARLFFDPRLSGPGTRSCASCHLPGRAFADGLVRAASIDPQGTPVARNTPTLLNAALAPAQFADERAATLEDQVSEVLRSPAEMSSSAERAAAVIDGVAEYRAAFSRVFGVEADTAVRARRLQFALAAYVRSLVALDSRFDRAVRGDTTQLSREERRGFDVFMGKGACGSCHFAPLFSGNTPPLYLGSDVEVIGTPASPDTPRELDADSGRARIDQMPLHLRAFKTPSLRNVAVTAPYMHNGRFATLEQVVDFYDRGGAAGVGVHIANQTLAPDSLHLTREEKSALIAFMKALTDTTPAGLTPKR